MQIPSKNREKEGQGIIRMVVVSGLHLPWIWTSSDAAAGTGEIAIRWRQRPLHTPGEESGTSLYPSPVRNPGQLLKKSHLPVRRRNNNNF